MVIVLVLIILTLVSVVFTLLIGGLNFIHDSTGDGGWAIEGSLFEIFPRRWFVRSFSHHLGNRISDGGEYRKYGDILHVWKRDAFHHTQHCREWLIIAFAVYQLVFVPFLLHLFFGGILVYLFLLSAIAWMIWYWQQWVGFELFKAAIRMRKNHKSRQFLVVLRWMAYQYLKWGYQTTCREMERHNKGQYEFLLKEAYGTPAMLFYDMWTVNIDNRTDGTLKLLVLDTPALRYPDDDDLPLS